MDRQGCFCCKARTCLVIWGSLGLLGSILIIPNTAETVDFTKYTAAFIMQILNSIIAMVLYVCILVSTLKKNTLLLKISFWFVFACLLFNLITLTVTAATVRGPNEEKVELSIVISGAIVACIIQGLLSWTIKRTLNEIEDEGYNGLDA